MFDQFALLTGRTSSLKHNCWVPNVFVASTELLRALEGGRLGGAALDVFESEKAPLEDHVLSLCRLAVPFFSLQTLSLTLERGP